MFAKLPPLPDGPLDPAIPASPPKPPSRLRRWLRRTLWDPATPNRLLLALGPWVSYLCMEYLNENDPFSGLNRTQLLFSMAWYYLIYWCVRMLLGRRRPAAAGSALVLFAIGLANHYVLTFRGRIIFPCDLMSLGTAVNVAAAYDYTPDRGVWIAAAILGAYMLLLLLAPREYGRKKLRRSVCAASLATAGVFLYAFFCTSWLPDSGIYAQQWKTQANGFLLNFMAALRYSFVSPPENYSWEAAEEIAGKAGPSGAPEAELPENLLVIMNESFADMQASFPNLELTTDPLEFFHSLTENTVKGTMIAPVTGGGTANVEFEFLTGDSLAFLPTNTVAYQLYCYDGIPNLASQLKSLGYQTVAFHPYLSSGWNRTSVYRWMGFDRQLYQDDVTEPRKIRDYISDSSDYEQLYRLTDEASGPLFAFNVTMQNHSGYTQGWENLERTVEVANEGWNLSGTAQYFSLMKASDDALRELIEHYQSSEERTMIVFFGDHQPPLGNAFYEKLYGKKLDDRTMEEVIQQYGVPFFIWANYDIPEQDGVVLSSNMLAALTLELAGIRPTGYQQLQQSLLEALPVNTTIGFQTAAGLLTDQAASLPPDAAALYEDYRIMAYNHLFDKSRHPAGYYR